MSKEVVTGASYVKGGSDPPLLPDSDYPDWLWDIMMPKEPLFSLQRKLGPERNIETIPLPEVRRPSAPACLHRRLCCSVSNSCTPRSAPVWVPTLARLTGGRHCA